MKHTVEQLKNRMHKLAEKDPVTNKNIINKLKRQIRAKENENGSK